MSTARKPSRAASSDAAPPAPPAGTAQAIDVARMNAALKASGIDYQVEGEVDMRAYAEAIGKRFPKITAKLAE